VQKLLNNKDIMCDIILILAEIAVFLLECKKLASKTIVKSEMVFEEWLQQWIMEKIDFSYSLESWKARKITS
jgi:hypothetical protein